MNPNEKSLQETYAPNMACFGCGPANEKGLHIRSFPDGDEVVATFEPATYQEAFPGMLSGGIIGTLLDCHCNWTAAYHLMKKAGADHPPCTVTADYTIKLVRPTPTDKPIQLRARVIDSTADRATVAGELIAHDKFPAGEKNHADEDDINVWRNLATALHRKAFLRLYAELPENRGFPKHGRIA